MTTIRSLIAFRMPSRENGASRDSLERLGNTSCVEFKGVTLERNAGFSWGNVFQENAEVFEQVKIPLTLAACQVIFIQTAAREFNALPHL